MTITRHFVDVGGRRVHYRRSGSGPPVVLLHESPRSSYALIPLLQRLGPGLTGFALDTPGYGDSDPLTLVRPDIADFADAVAAAMAAIGIDAAPVYGTHTGASIALECAARHPKRCIAALLDGFPVFTPAEQADSLSTYLPPFLPSADGTHMAWLWARVRDQFLFFPWNRYAESARLWRALPDARFLTGVALDFLRAGDFYRVGYAAAFRHRPRAALASLTVPTVIGAREDDLLFGHLDRLPDLPAGVAIDRFSANRDLWGERMRAHFLAHATGAAPPVSHGPLPAARVGGTYVDLPGGGQIFVRGATGGEGLPLVLIHPSPGGSSYWFDSLQRLAGRRPVLAFDLPGHGDSDPPSAPGLDGVVESLELALARLGIDAAELRGAGTGAVVAGALQRINPGRYRSVSMTDLPVAGVAPPPALIEGTAGGHLMSAWYQVRDDAILGPWYARPARHRCGSDLDVQALHRQTIDLLKAPFDLVLLHEMLAATG
jgi:pimeloyl-ACP methyl ester carboxylesterase